MALAAADLLMALIDGAEFRGDALTIESITCTTMQHVHAVGGGGGRVGGEVLAQELMNSQENQARRAYFDSIVALDLNATLLFDFVRDSRWFVVRNAVALLGEMGVEQADAVMLPQRPVTTTASASPPNARSCDSAPPRPCTVCTA